MHRSGAGEERPPRVPVTMDPPTLDTAIQHALAGLYPPFEATAPTVLGQVFRLLDSDFQGDGLSFLLDFLIPAKRLCEQVREAACAPYAHCLFLHAGWPLCLRDKVVVHLAPLNPLLLRRGDFYLQVEPREEQSVCMMVKRLSLDLRTVDHRPVPESSYPLLFTPQWLQAINSDSEGSPLHSCLVASENGVAPVPWNKIASPEFVDDRPAVVNTPSPGWGSQQLGVLDLSSPQELGQAGPPGGQVFLTWSLVKGKGKGRTAGDKYPGLIKVERARPGELAFGVDSVDSQGLEGDYVALLGFSQKSRGPGREAEPSGGHTFGAPEELSRTMGLPLSERILPHSGPSGAPRLEKWTHAKPEVSEEKSCALNLRRKNQSKAPAPAAGQPGPPYINVPEETLPHASGLGEGVSEEVAVPKMQGSPETTVQPRPGPTQASSPGPTLEPPAAPLSDTKMEKTQRGNRSRPQPGARASQSSASSSGAPTPGIKLPFLKGQRQSPVPPEKASLQHDGPWRVLRALYSPKPSPATSSGRDGKTQRKTSGPAADSGPLTRKKAGLPEAAAEPPGSGPGLEEEPLGPAPGSGALGSRLLPSGIACLPGSRDRAGRPVLLVLTAEGSWEAPWCTASEVAKLLSYLCSIPRSEDKAKGLVVVVDARKQPPRPELASALRATQALAPATIHTLLFLGEKEDALHLQALPDVQVEVLTSLKVLGHHVDPSQLPAALEGPFPYCHSEWVQFFQKLDPFLAELRQASALLQAAIGEFEKAEPPGGVQEATRCLGKSKELMEAVLRDPGLLGLQREGGATLARLRQEASRLDFNPDVRSRLAEAATLYSLVDEQLHVLVTASNQLLGKLELRVRLGHLKAAIAQVSDWMEQEGSRCLQELAPRDGSLEAVETAHAEFEDFFLQVAAQYRRGLELSKQAAQLGAAAGAGETGETGPRELAAFACAQRAFQARLTHFYMAAERQRTDLETLLHLHHFCKKMSWLHMDCQDLMTQLRLGRAQRASPGDQRRLHRYLQRLTSEFPEETLTAMGRQVASLSRADLGQGLWEEAQARHEEIHSLLRKALAPGPGPAAPAAQPARLELRGAAPRSQGPKDEVTSKGKRDPPLQEPLGALRAKSSWPPGAARRRRGRNVQAAPTPTAGRAAEAGEDPGLHGPPAPAPERFLASLFSWPRAPRQSQAPCPTGGSFSSEGTDSQTSLEDSPQTSPPASL